MNKEEAIALVSKNGLELRHLPFINDKDVVMAAVHENITSFVFASEELHDDKDVVMSVIRLQNNKDTYAGSLKTPSANRGVESYPLVLPIALVSERLREDKDVMMQAVRVNGSYIRYAVNIRNDNDLVTEAIKTFGAALEYASDLLKNDETIVLSAIQQNSGNLLFASPELKRNREIVMTAISNYGMGHCILLADPIFKDDLDIIMTALEHNNDGLGGAREIYNFASARCKIDLEVLSLCIEGLAH
jgi:hypothetical protein